MKILVILDEPTASPPRDKAALSVRPRHILAFVRDEEMMPWEPGKHGNGIVFVDETVASWSIDSSTGLPGHEHGLRASGRDWEEVLTFLVVSSEGEVQLRSPLQDSPSVDLRRMIADHDSRMHLDDGSNWADMFR